MELFLEARTQVGRDKITQGDAATLWALRTSLWNSWLFLAGPLGGPKAQGAQAFVLRAPIPSVRETLETHGPRK